MSQEALPTQVTDVKPELDPTTINVKVVSATGEEVFFKIKRTTKLSKLQGAYANKVGKDVSGIRFLYDGARINEEDTPSSLDMEDNDTIDVMVERTSCSLPFLVPPTLSSLTSGRESLFAEVGGWSRRL
ncbi:ubiquitin-2 like Rad60 SUMO-like-domain-containing protein [Russula brevipes]|nr:ubiquitin-2 like Rad60 SUMO-like-domain-containing protein [Russula brevipes]